MAKLVFEFDNEKALELFASWLCEAGEQDYWQWMEYREEEEEGPITVTQFIYHAEDKSKAKNDPARYGRFLAERIIRTECGRLDHDKANLTEDGQ